MGYKQHNNPFSRKISSPLKHNVTNAAGETWRHGHRDDGRTISLEAKNIAGSSTFGQRSNRKIKGRSEKDLAMEYANQLANAYNKGAITGGNFLADDFSKSHTYRRGGKKKDKGFLTKLTGLDIFTDNMGRVVVDRGKKRKSIGGTNQYNVQQGEWDKEAKAYKNIPTEQVTPEQIYDMMVQGGGMVSIVDGKIVAGNPNEVKYDLSDVDYNKAAFQGTNKYTTSFQDADYTPEGFTSDYDQRSNDKTGALTVKELLELRKQKLNNPINMMKNSPLQSNHDQRSDGPLEGFDYTPDEPVITTRTEEVLDDDGNIIGYNDITTTTTTNTGQREIQGDPTPPPPPNWNDCYINGVFQTGMVVGEGPDAIKCEFRDPDDTPVDPVEPTIETDTYDDVTEEVVFRPVEPDPPVEEDDSGPPPLDLGVSGVSQTRGGDFRFHIPDIDLMGGIRAVIDGVVFTNKGRCKAGCATNKNS